MIERLTLVFLVCSALPSPARDGTDGAESRRRVRRFNAVLPETETSAPRKATPEEILHWTLEMVHGSSLDVQAIAESLAQYDGWSVERVRNAYLETALDKHEEPRARNGAIQFYCKLSGADELAADDMLLSNEEDFVRTAVMAAVFNSLTNGSTRLEFAKRCLESHSEGDHLTEVSRVVSSRLSAYLDYGNPNDQERREFVLFYRQIAEQARTAVSASSADLFLSQYDPEWNQCQDRRSLLEKWKDDPSLSDFARNRMRKALADMESSKERSGVTNENPQDSAEPELPAFDDSPEPAPDDSGAPADGKAAGGRSRAARFAVFAVLALVAVLFAAARRASRRRG